MSDALSAGLPRPSAERLAADLGVLEAFTRPDRPYTRRAFSDEDRAARQWLAGRMAAAGPVPAVDPAGNQIGRRAGARPGPAFVIGSSGSSWSSCSASIVISPDRARRGSVPVGSRRLRGAPCALPRV